MAIKTHNPTSAGRRFYTTPSYEEITKKTPEKSLLAKKEKEKLKELKKKRKLEKVSLGIKK